MKRIDLTDLLLFLGAACIVWGIAQIYVPAAWIAAGIFMIGIAFLILKERANNASSAKSD
jgi:Flp pilus assembly protein TadB